MELTNKSTQMASGISKDMKSLATPASSTSTADSANSSALGNSDLIQNFSDITNIVPSMLKLAKETILDICSYLENQDIKSLRSACSKLADLAEFHLHRVFLSPDKEVLEVFWIIANDPVYRYKVKEILWDDSIFGPIDPLSSREDEVERFHDEFHEQFRAAFGEKGDDDHARYYKKMKGTERPLNYRDRDGDTASYMLHEVMVEEEQEIINAGKTFEALEYGLKIFDNLESVVMSQSWQHLELDRPLLHLLPKEFLFNGRYARFDYPRHISMEEDTWWQGGAMMNEAKKYYLENFCDYDVVTSLLAHTERRKPITRLHFLADSSRFLNLLNPDGNSDSVYRNSCKVFKHLRQLDLHVYAHEWSAAAHLNASLPTWGVMIWNMIREGSKMEDLSIKIGFLSEYETGIGLSLANAMPSNPALYWPLLRRLHLQNMEITGDILLPFLLTLPSNIQEISLDYLCLRGDPGDITWKDILDSLSKAQPRWLLSNLEHSRPKFSIAQLENSDLFSTEPGWQIPEEPIAVKIEKVIDEFFNGGPNPFVGDMCHANLLERICPHMGESENTIQIKEMIGLLTEVEWSKGNPHVFRDDEIHLRHEIRRKVNVENEEYVRMD